MTDTVADLDGPNAADKVWARLTENARRLLVKFGTTANGEVLPERVAFALKGEPTETVAAALAELLLLKLIEAVHLKKEPRPGYAVSPTGFGVLTFGRPENAEAAAETQRVTQYLNRSRGE